MSNKQAMEQYTYWIVFVEHRDGGDRCRCIVGRDHLPSKIELNMIIETARTQQGGLGDLMDECEVRVFGPDQRDYMQKLFDTMTDDNSVMLTANRVVH